MTVHALKGKVIRPSELGPNEIALWHRMLAQSPSLQRAFFTPAFALACERATGRAYVAVLHSGATIQGFLPFQFKSAWHQRIRLAERIGGDMSDASGLIACPNFRISSTSLLRSARLGALHLSHIMNAEDQPGLNTDWSQISYVSDLGTGPDAYFTGLATRNRDFVRDTERRIRKARTTYGDLSLQGGDCIPASVLDALIAAKRQQYVRTQVADPFALSMPLRLIKALNDVPSPECRLVLAKLEAGGRTLGQHLGLQHHGILSWWFPVYDTDAQGVSPGRLLLWYMIRNAKQDGISLIDYGEGEAQYKRQFCTGTLQLGRAMWSGCNVHSLLARAWQSMEWRLARRTRRASKATAQLV
jgi:CelD/BcsL family acetyltransferase involved in cellulose biosynthesis